MTPYYQRDGITLYHGDCREILPNVAADVVIMDPPYNCGINYGELTDDNLPWPEWCAWFDGVRRWHGPETAHLQSVDSVGGNRHG